MNTQNDGGPAFPFVIKESRDNGLGQTVEVITREHFGGLSKLDWFAGQALAAIAHRGDCLGDTYHETAEIAYDMAEAMINERAKRYEK